MKDGTLIGVFAVGGYLSINMRGRRKNGHPKFTVAARAAGPARALGFMQRLADDYGGKVVPGRGRGWAIEFTSVKAVEDLCEILSMSPYPLPERLETEVEIMIRFLGYKMRPGPSQDPEILEGRLEAYYDMRALKGI